MKIIIKILLFFIIPFFLLGQNGSVIIGDNGNIIMNGKINLIINQPSNQGIQKIGNLEGGIICDNEQSRVIWGISTSIGNYVIPFKISNTLIPFSMNIIGAGTGTGKVLVSTYHTAIDNTPYANGNSYFSSVTNVWFNGIDNSFNVVDRFWIINYADYITTPISEFIMTYDEANDLNGIIENDLQAQYWNGSEWVLPTTGIANPFNDNVTVIPSVNQNAPWVLVNKTTPLPIILTYFNAICIENGIKIMWTTAWENNVDRYEIYKSYDAVNYTLFATEDAVGYSIIGEGYLIYDYDNFNGNIYYQLKSIDNDGYTEWFDPISINCEITNSNIIIHPNPSRVGDPIKVLGDIYNIEIFDVIGRKIVVDIIDNQIHGLSAGVYIFVINKKYQGKIIVK